MITVNIIPPPPRISVKARYAGSLCFFIPFLPRTSLSPHDAHPAHSKKNAEAHVLSVFVLSAVRDPHSGNFDDERLLS